MTRTDVMASSRPRTPGAALKRKGTRARRKLVALPDPAPDGPGSGSSRHRVRRRRRHLGLQPGTEQTGHHDHDSDDAQHGHVAVERRRHAGNHAEQRNRTYGKLDEPGQRRIENPAVHRLRPALELRHRPAADGSRLLDRRRATSPPFERALDTPKRPTLESRRPSGRRLFLFPAGPELSARVPVRPLGGGPVGSGGGGAQRHLALGGDRSCPDRAAPPPPASPRLDRQRAPRRAALLAGRSGSLPAAHAGCTRGWSRRPLAGAPAGGRPRACRHGHRDAVARTAPAAVCAADGPAIPDRSRRIAGARPHVHGASRRADRALVATVAERTAFGGARGADRAVRTGRGTPVDQLPRTAGHRRRVRDARRLSECAAGHGGRTERAAGRPAEAEKAPRLHPPHRDLRAPRARRPAGDRRGAAHDGGDGTARPGPDRVDPGAERRRMAREGAVQAPRGGAEPRAAPASRHARPLDGRGRRAARGPRRAARPLFFVDIRVVAPRRRTASGSRSSCAPIAPRTGSSSAARRFATAARLSEGACSAARATRFPALHTRRVRPHRAGGALAAAERRVRRVPLRAQARCRSRRRRPRSCAQRGQGTLRDALGPVSIHAELRRQNIAVPGTVEQGKSSFLVASVAEDLRRERCAVIVLDPKGDAAEAALSAVPPGDVHAARPRATRRAASTRCA